MSTRTHHGHATPWADLPDTTPAEHAWKYGGIFTQGGLTDDTRLAIVSRQLTDAIETRGSGGLVFLGRAYDARTGIYAGFMVRNGDSLGLGGTLAPCIRVSKERQLPVAWIEADGTITVTDCGIRSTSTTCGIEWALGNGAVRFDRFQLCALNARAGTRGQWTGVQTINSKRGVIL